MPDSLPRTAQEQLAYWLEFGVDKFVYVIKAKDDPPIKGLPRSPSPRTQSTLRAKKAASTS